MRHSIKNFIEDGMEVKLQRDDPIKKPWETQPINLLDDFLKEERKEVDDALRRWMATGTDVDRVALMMELADEANTLMMIFSNLHQVSRHYRRGHPVKRLPRTPQPEPLTDNEQNLSMLMNSSCEEMKHQRDEYDSGYTYNEPGYSGARTKP